MNVNIKIAQEHIRHMINYNICNVNIEEEKEYIYCLIVSFVYGCRPSLKTKILQRMNDMNVKIKAIISNPVAQSTRMSYSAAAI